VVHEEDPTRLVAAGDRATRGITGRRTAGRAESHRLTRHRAPASFALQRHLDPDLGPPPERTAYGDRPTATLHPVPDRPRETVSVTVDRVRVEAGPAVAHERAQHAPVVLDKHVGGVDAGVFGDVDQGFTDGAEHRFLGVT